MFKGKAKATSVKVLRVPGGWGYQISWQRHRMVVSCHPTRRPPLPQEIFLLIISVRGCVDPRVKVRPEGLWLWKIPMISSGIEPANFWLVSQCLNQLRYRVFPYVDGAFTRDTETHYAFWSWDPIFLASFITPNISIFFWKKHHEVLEWMNNKINYIRQHYLFTYT